MENEIMNNEQVVAEAAEVLETNAENGVMPKVVVGAAIIAGGVLAFKGAKIVINKVIKPAIAKVKAKKAEKSKTVECVECTVVEVNDVDS